MTEKGYYSRFNTSTGTAFPNTVIHGGSYSIPAKNVDFVTWKKNMETGEYWSKIHTISGKEIRLRVSYDELNQLLRICGNDGVEYGNGDEQ